MLRLSLQTLRRRRTRTALAVTGIAISTALLLDMTMLATGLTDSFGEMTRARGFGLRVTPRGTLPFDSEAGIGNASDLARRIEGLVGVAGVAPVLGAQLHALDGDSVREPLFTVGIDPAAQMLYVLVAGRDPARGEVVVSRPLAESYGLVPGDSLRLAAELDLSLGQPRSARDFLVAGVGDFLYDYADQRSLAARIEDVQLLTRRPDEVSLFGVAATEPTLETAIAREIEALTPEITAYSTAELMRAMDERLLYFRQLATILGSVALLVTALLIGTIVTIGIRERFAEIATLRAIGVAPRRILLGILAEGLVLSGLGATLGIPLGLWMAGRLDGILTAFPGLPAGLSFFVFDATRLGVALAIVVATGAAAGLLPGTGALRIPLSRALREESE